MESRFSWEIHVWGISAQGQNVVQETSWNILIPTAMLAPTIIKVLDPRVWYWFKDTLHFILSTRWYLRRKPTASGMDNMKTQLLQLCEAGGLDQQGGKLCYSTVHTRSMYSTDDPGSQSFLPSQRSCRSCDVSRDSYLECVCVCVPWPHVLPDRHRMGFCGLFKPSSCLQHVAMAWLLSAY